MHLWPHDDIHGTYSWHTKRLNNQIWIPYRMLHAFPATQIFISTITAIIDEYTFIIIQWYQWFLKNKESVYVMFNLQYIQVKDKHEVHMMHASMVTTHGVFQLLGGVEAKDTWQHQKTATCGDIDS